jgi:hypothetical protein
MIIATVNQYARKMGPVCEEVHSKLYVVRLRDS